SIACGPVSTCYLSAIQTLYTNQRSPGLWQRLRAMVAGPRPKAAYLPRVDERVSEMPLFSADRLAKGWELEAIGEQVHAGRATVRVRATRTRTGAHFGLWPFVQEYDVLVDEERGVLL